MKKLIAVLLTLTMLLACALPAFAFPLTEEGADREFGIAKGYVCTKETLKSSNGYTNVKVWTYNKQGKLVSRTENDKDSDGNSSSFSTKCTYDKKGNLTKQVEYYDSFVTTTTYAYNNKGKVTKEVSKMVSEDNSVWTMTRTYTYNKAGEVAKELAYYDDCEDIKTYTYDKKGNVTKEVQTQSYDDNTTTRTTTTCVYDANGNETKMTYVIKDRYGSVEKQVQTYTYNEKNLCVKKTETWSLTNEDGETSSSRDVTTYVYDKNGNETKEKFKSTDGDGNTRTVSFLYTYDADGNCTKWVTTEKSSYYSGKTTKNYAYKAGLLVKETTVTKDDDGVSKSTETYAYDKAGNLTKYVNAYSYAYSGSGKDVTTYAYQKIGA